MTMIAITAAAALMAGMLASDPTDTSLDDAYVLGFELPRMGGEVQELSDYEGKVVLIVNVASRCGLTPQYEGLQSLYEAKKDRGFEILGFPANDFGRQEPGSNESILEFCSGEYGVTFPMFEKVVVTGEDATPLYQALASQPEPIGGEPRWNFTKFLVDRDGRVVARFGPRVAPEAAELVEQVDALLGDSDS